MNKIAQGTVRVAEANRRLGIVISSDQTIRNGVEGLRQESIRPPNWLRAVGLAPKVMRIYNRRSVAN
jgi:hypothetical protein